MDKNSEAVRIAKNLTPYIEQVNKKMMDNCMRSKLYTVSSAPTDGKIGVKDAFDDVEMKIPYSSSIANVKVGDAVWCIWMSNNQSTMVALWAGDIVSYKGEKEPEPYTELWTNPRPTSDFAAQTIPLDLRKWKWIAIKTLFNPSSATYGSTQLVGVGDNRILSVENLSTNSYVAKREVAVSSSGVTFGAGYRTNTGTSGNTYCLPVAIYGVC